LALTLILSQLREKGQIELCDRHAEAVIAREQRCGFEIFDRRLALTASADGVVENPEMMSPRHAGKATPG
jgi:hypothetical protein